MSARDLMRRLDRLEPVIFGDSAAPDDGTCIDPKSLTDEQRAAIGRVPRTEDGKVRMEAVAEEDLRIIATIRIVSTFDDPAN